MALLLRSRWQTVLFTAVLGFLALNVILSFSTVVYGAQIDAVSNQQQHAEILREVDRVNGRVSTIDFYMQQLQAMNIQERLTMIEANQQAIVNLGTDLARMLWGMITGIMALVGERAYVSIKSARGKRGV